MFGFDPVTYKTININKASTNGVELYLSTEPSSNIRIKTNYTFTEITDKSDGSGSSILMRRPKHKVSFIIDYIFLEDASAALEVLYTGRRNDIYYSGSFIAPPLNIIMGEYTLVNINFSYRLFDIVKIYTRAENIFNRKYEEIYGFGTPGLAVFAGVKINTNNFLD
jgi:vitamin B12 transporter